MAARAESLLTYGVVYGTLLLLTALTVGVSFLELGDWHGPVGMLIAAAKATLVAFFFMHLLHSRRLIWLVAGAALFWLGILLTFTFADYMSRSWIEGRSGPGKSVIPSVTDER
jgi:cytochrome c oxidase subunit 4